MQLAERAAVGHPNALARARAELATAGAEVTDLSDSNPTRHGLLPSSVLETVARHAAGALHHEPHSRGPLAARHALATRYGGDPDDYWLTSSTSQGYAWLLALLTDPGDAVATPSPGYPLLEPIARLADVHTVNYPLHYADPDGWILDSPALARTAAEPTVRAVIAVNPGNPTGAYLTGAADDVVTACAAHGLALISDEVFHPFTVDGPAGGATPRSFAGADGVVTFTLGGLSKLLCAPQLKLAWIRISGPAADLAPIRDALDTVADTFLPVNGPVAAALPELLDLGDQVVDGVRARLAQNLVTARDILSDGPYRVRRCEGGWTVLIDVPQNLPVDDIAVHLLRRHRLAIHPGWFYDLPSNGTLALSLLPEPDRFAAGLKALRAAVDDLAHHEV